MKSVRFVAEAMSEGDGTVIRAGGWFVRAKEALTGGEVTACCPENDPEVGGTLMIALTGGLLFPVVPILSVFWSQNQPPSGGDKHSSTAGNSFRHELRQLHPAPGAKRLRSPTGARPNCHFSGITGRRVWTKDAPGVDRLST